MSRAFRESECLLLLLIATFSSPVFPDEYPVRPIRIVAGPGPDVVARIIGQRLTDVLGQQVIVDPRPAAGGIVAAETVAKATPDGYTMLLAASTYPINAAFGLGTYNLEKDFSAVALAVTTPLVLLVTSSLQVASVRDLVELAKSKPGLLNYSSSGQGANPHLAGELFKSLANVNIVHVAYNGAAQAILNVASGQVQMTFTVPANAYGQIQSGKVRALAVTTLQRSRLMPDLPTMAEAGVRGYEVTPWNGFLAPARTPKSVVVKLNAEILRAMKQADVIQRLTGAGYDVMGDNTPEQFADFVKREIVKWAKVVKDLGLKPN